MKNRWLVVLLALFVTSGTVLLIFQRGDLQTGDAKGKIDYTLTVMLPETGNLAFIGQPTKCALTLAAQDMQSDLSKDDIKIDMVFADTQGNPREAVTQFGRYVELGKSNGIITTLSGVIGAISPLAKNKEQLFIALTPDPSFLKENPYGMRVLSSLGGPRLTSLIKERGYKRGLILHSTDAATMYDVTQLMIPDLKASGVELTVDTFDVGQRDFKNLAAKHAGAALDFLVIHGFGSELPYVAQACAGFPNLKSAALLLSLGTLDSKPDVRSALVGGQFFAPAFLDSESPLFNDFKKRFVDHCPGMTPGYPAIYAYESYTLLANALMKTHSAKALDLKKSLQSPIKALTQEYRFDSQGDFVPEMILMQVAADGSFVTARK